MYIYIEPLGPSDHVTQDSPCALNIRGVNRAVKPRRERDGEPKPRYADEDRDEDRIRVSPIRRLITRSKICLKATTCVQFRSSFVSSMRAFYRTIECSSFPLLVFFIFFIFILYFILCI